MLIMRWNSLKHPFNGSFTCFSFLRNLPRTFQLSNSGESSPDIMASIIRRPDAVAQTDVQWQGDAWRLMHDAREGRLHGRPVIRVYVFHGIGSDQPIRRVAEDPFHRGADDLRAMLGQRRKRSSNARRRSMAWT